MPQERRQTTRWLYGMPFLHGIVYRVSVVLIACASRVFCRPRLLNMECLPKEEPYLLLPNHSSMLDPFWVGAPIPRGVKAMASASLFRIPVVGLFLTMVGCFPKKKFTKDRESMLTLQEQFDQGYVVLIFPEGNRSWNGETAQITQGIGRLIKRLDCKVVYARINSAYLYQPRWARYPRWVPIEATYDGPHEYDETISVEEITADVQEHLTVVPHLKRPARVWGFRMAHGLPQYLWACPVCYQLDALTVPKRRGNTIRCQSCEAQWDVDVYSRMSGASDVSVADAFRIIEAHFGSPPVAVSEDYETDGVALLAPEGQLLYIPRDKKRPEVEAEGAIQVHRDGFRVVEGTRVIWEASYDTIRGISVEMANLLHFRIGDRLYRLVIPGDSPLKWDHFLRKWRLHVVGAEH